MSYIKKPIFIKDSKIKDGEFIDKIIIDTVKYPCPCSDCGGDNITIPCLLDARIIELQNKFNNVKTYFNQKDKQYIITIPKKIKIPYNKDNSRTSYDGNLKYRKKSNNNNNNSDNNNSDNNKNNNINKNNNSNNYNKNSECSVIFQIGDPND